MPLAMSRLNWRLVLAFAAFGIIASLEPSLHFRWMFSGGEKQYLSVMFQADLPEGVVRWKAIAFLAVDVLLVAGYAIIGVIAWRRLGDRAAVASSA